MIDINELPLRARLVVQALLSVPDMVLELSGFDGVSSRQIAVDGKPTPLRWDGTSVFAKVAGTEAILFLVITQRDDPEDQFEPRVDVKVGLPLMNEAELLNGFLSVGVHDFQPHATGTEGIVHSPPYARIQVANVSTAIPWYISYSTRAILGSKAAFRLKSQTLRRESGRD